MLSDDRLNAMCDKINSMIMSHDFSVNVTATLEKALICVKRAQRSRSPEEQADYMQQAASIMSGAAELARRGA